MKEAGVSPNVYTYTSLMTAAAEKMDALSVERIFHMLKKEVSIMSPTTTK